MLNRKQKILILATALLLVASFLFPPWGDYFPTARAVYLDYIAHFSGSNPSGEQKTVTFIGYRLLFNRPSYYLHDFHSEFRYTEEAQKAIEDRKVYTGEIKLYGAELLLSGKDSIAAIQHYDSLITAGTIVTMENNQLYGFAGIYHELLLIQLALTVLISISLIFVLRD